MVRKKGSMKIILGLTMALMLIAGSSFCLWHTEYAYASMTGKMKDELTLEKKIPEAHAGSSDIETEEKSVRTYVKSSDTGEMLAGARFLLMEWSEKKGKYVELMTLEEGTDKEGDPFYYNAEPFRNSMDNLGRYQVREIQAPPGCVPAEEPWIFTIGQDTKISTHTFTGSLQKVSLELEKKGDDGELLPGIVLQIKAAEDICAPRASDEASDKYSSLLVAKGTVVDTLITDEDGIARSTQGKELYVGEYLIREMEGAEGYLLNPEPHKITLRYSTEIKDAVIPYTASFINPKIKPSMAVAKLADHTMNPFGAEVKMNQAAGRYVEKKISGIYAPGETVDFKVTVTNTGNTGLYELRLSDTIYSVNEDGGYSLKDYVEKDSSRFEIPREGYFVSSRRNQVNACREKDDPMTLILERLPAGDSVVVHFLCKVKASATDAFDLKNVVNLTAVYRIREGEDIPVELRDVPTEELVDEKGNPLTGDSDLINILSHKIKMPVVMTGIFI